MSTVLNKNRGLLDAALEIEKRRGNTLVLARVAAENNDLKEVKRLLAELVPDEILHRALKSEHDGPSRRGSRVIAFAANHQPRHR